ncbi:MAG TPA: hypothetical protein DCX61_06030, partial [Gemmatimonadetes bacterium]|nr:hypothetical protein [Gemmatimonadota bacterium]
FKAPLTLGPQGVLGFGSGDSTPEDLGWSSIGEPTQFGPDLLLKYDREADVMYQEPDVMYREPDV